jgi:hypothetical protein
MYVVGANGNIPEGTDEDNTRCAVAIQQDCELRKVSQILQFEHGAEFSGGACHGTVFIKRHMCRREARIPTVVRRDEFI